MRWVTRTATTLTLLLFAAPVLAGEAYSFTVEREGHLMKSEAKGRFLVEGRSYRVELEPSSPDELRGYDVLISRDAGETETALDLERHTYFTPKNTDKTSDALLVLVGGSGPVDRTARSVQLKTGDSPEPETIAGVTTRVHEIKLDYRVEIKFPGETVKGTVHMEARYWMTADGAPALLPRLVRPDLRTSFPEIDVRLAAELAKLTGLPVKQEVTIHSDVVQGAAQESHTLITLQRRGKTATPPPQFAIPGGFQFKEPVFSGPG